MTTYRVDSFEVEGLWGFKDFDFCFDPDVNIFIGLNASGKTTLLRLLHAIFSGDFYTLQEIEFDKTRVSLRSFSGESKRTIEISTTDSGFNCRISNKRYKVDLDQAIVREDVYRTATARTYRRFRNTKQAQQLREASTELQSLVPSVWLPVSRRLPMPEEEHRRISMSELERLVEVDSVDMRLRELSDELAKYRLRLDARLSDRYNEFEKQVLGIILYSEDDVNETLLAPFSEDEKNLLLSAFEEAGLLDDTMRRRIERHFSVAEQVVRDIAAWRPDEEEMPDKPYFSILPLIPRTRVMIRAAQNLEEEREEIFTPLRTYEKTMSSFFGDKALTVLNNGEIKIDSLVGSNDEPRSLPIERLSSGEKQILILLTQALLEHEDPVVYLADEPELSLHVTWQEKLIEALDTLGGQTQIIVATHSPDIVGPYTEKVIDLAAKH